MFPASNHGPGQNIGFPDVCLTPGVPPVPVPYPNLGSNAMAVPTAPNVLISGMPGQNMGSMPTLTNGDNAGCIHPVGMMKPGGTTMGNPLVAINGLPAKHLLCPSQGNTFNDPIGATLVPDVVNVMYCDLGESACVDLFDLPDTSLGLTVVPARGGLRVLHVRRGGLAERLELRPEDLLLRQDGRRLESCSDLAPIAAGRDTELQVARKGWASPRGLRGRQGLRRASAVSVRRRGPREARLILRRLSHDAPAQTRRALVVLRLQGVERVELDLRGNPGGGLAAAVGVVSAFLPRESEAARLEVRDGELRLLTAADPVWTGGLSVLVDRQAASAAEVVAAALRAHDRALLHGEATFGKRSVEGLGLGRVGLLSSLPATGLEPDRPAHPLQPGLRLPPHTSNVQEVS